MQQIGRQLWPLFVGWAALALFIVYAAVASMGVFAWLPIDWHLAGPVGLFESLMVTLALGLNLRKIQADKLGADAKYAQSMAERVRSEEHTSELQSLMRISYAVFCLKKKTNQQINARENKTN